MDYYTVSGIIEKNDMRMWMVNPELMCSKHLLGEHVELHMLAGCLQRGKNIDGFLKGGLVDPSLLHVRHEALVREMEKRGYQHRSPIENCDYPLIKGDVDVQANVVELSSKCEDCRALFDEAGRTHVDSI